MLLRDEDQFWMENTYNNESNPVSVTNGANVKRQNNAMKNTWDEEKPN